MMIMTPNITIGMMSSTDILLLKMMDILLQKLRLPDTPLRVPDMKLQVPNMVLRLMNPLRHIMHRVTEEMMMDLTIFWMPWLHFCPLDYF